MTDPDQSGTSAGETASDQETPETQQGTAETQQETPETQQETAAQDRTESTASDAGKADTAESAVETSHSGENAAEPETAEPETAEPETAGQETAGQETAGQETAEQENNRSRSKKSKTGLLLGLVSGAFVLLLAAVLVAFFVWPGYAGPGSPNSKADEAAAALASKDSDQLEQVSCHGEDGKSLAQISPEALQLVQSAKPAGEPQKILDTEAQAPVDLTLSAQGQTQTLPSTAILGVSDHEWCLKGLAQRQ